MVASRPVAGRVAASMCLCADEYLEGVCACLYAHVIVSLSMYHLCGSV